MKTAIVKRRQRDLVDINCPICKSRHWIPNRETGMCPRRRGPAFVIRQANSKEKSK